MVTIRKFSLAFSRTFWTDRSVQVLLGLSVAVNALSWYALWRVARPDSGFLTLHYTISIGIDRIGSWSELFIMPGLGTGVFLLNTLIAWMIWRQSTLARLLIAGVLVVEVFIAISVFFLITQFI